MIGLSISFRRFTDALRAYALCVVLVLGVSLSASADNISNKTYMIELLPPSAEPVQFQVELAQTPKLRRSGLMGRKHLDVDKGMLFIWPHPAQRQFWMKNTFIELDILFFDTSGMLAHIVHSATPLSEELLSSQKVVGYVLEIQGGLAKKLSLTEGTAIHIPEMLPPAE